MPKIEGEKTEPRPDQTEGNKVRPSEWLVEIKYRQQELAGRAYILKNPKHGKRYLPGRLRKENKRHGGDRSSAHEQHIRH